MIGGVGVEGQRSQPETPGVGGDVVKVQALDVHQAVGLNDVIFEQIQQIGAAGQKAGSLVGVNLGYRLGAVGGAGIVKRLHAPCTCRMALTMFR